MLRAAIAGFRGDIPRWLTLARQALEILPLTDVLGRTAATLNLASALLLSGDASMENESLLRATVASARTSGGVRSSPVLLPWLHFCGDKGDCGRRR